MGKIMQDGFGRPIDEDIYWHNSGLSEAAIERVKEYHRTHPVQEDGTRLKDKDSIRMGKAKTQRTEAYHQAARRYILAKQAQQAIEQHNLDKLVAQGLIVEGGLPERLNPQRRPVVL